MVHRERVEKIAFARMMARFSGMASDAFEPMLAPYIGVVTHEAFNQERQKPDPQVSTDHALLSKVDKLTIEGPLPSPKKKTKRRR